MQPTESHSISGYGLCVPNEVYLFYKPTGNCALQIFGLDGFTGYTAEWFHPLTGDRLTVEPQQERAWKEFRGPWGETLAILKLER
jgi:hypothetical protein